MVSLKHLLMDWTQRLSCGLSCTVLTLSLPYVNAPCVQTIIFWSCGIIMVNADLKSIATYVHVMLLMLLSWTCHLGFWLAVHRMLVRDIRIVIPSGH